MSRFFRESKYRHMFSDVVKRNEWYEDIPISTVNSDNPSLTTSRRNIACIGGNGNSMYVLPLSSIGKVHEDMTHIHAHSQQITDLSFSNIYDNTKDQLMSVSMDGTAKLWDISHDNNTYEAMTEPVMTLNNNYNSLKGLSWHYSASNIVSLQSTNGLHVWDVEQQSEVYNFINSCDIYDSCWSYHGNLMCLTGRDKELRLIDIRQQNEIGNKKVHAGNKSFRLTWAGNSNTIITTGRSMMQEREFALWDHRNLDKPIKRERLDTSTGIILPYYDISTNLLFLCGRGDTNIRIYEIENEKLFPISNNSLGEPLQGFSFIPKFSLDLMKCEVNRMLKLANGIIYPISFKVPRKDKLHFHEDLYPNTLNGNSSITNTEWLNGQNCDPILGSVNLSTATSNNNNNNQNEQEEKKIDEKDELKEEEEKKGNEENENIRESIDVEPRGSSSWRSSLQNKYKHLRAIEPSRERSNYNLQPNTTNSDSPLIACSHLFWAVPWKGAAGPVYISRHDQLGKVEPDAFVINGHRAPVFSCNFSPFDDNLLITGGDDSQIKLWRIPDNGLERNYTAEDAEGELIGHQHTVRTLDFHPTANHLLLSSSTDNTFRIWDINTQSESLCLSNLVNEQITNCSWNYNGSLFSTSCKDKILRIIDPRSNNITSEIQAHPGGRGFRTQWCTRDNGEYDLIATTGFGYASDRQLKLWDPRLLNKPLKTKTLDQASGTLFPFWDEDIGLIYLAGRGDTTIRLFELTFNNETSLITECSSFQSTDGPLSGIAMMPKDSCDIRDIEVSRFLRLGLTSLKTLKFKMPRAAHLKPYFQDDVYIPTRTNEHVISSSEWLSGNNENPKLKSLQPNDMKPVSTKPDTRPKISSAQKIRQQINKEEEAEKKRLAAFDRMTNLANIHAKYNPNQSMQSDSDDEDWS